MSVHRIHAGPVEVRRARGTIPQGLEMVVICHEGAGHWTLVPLQEQTVLLSTELRLQPLIFPFQMPECIEQAASKSKKTNSR